MKDYKRIHTYSFAEYTQNDLGLVEFFAAEDTLEVSEGLHAHDWIEMIYIIRGEGLLQVNGEEYPFQKGSLMRLFPFHIHALKKTTEIPVEYVCCRFPLAVLLYLDVNFSKRYSSYYILEHLAPLVELPRENKDKIHQSFLEIITENKLKNEYSNNLIIAELTRITIYFERASQQLEMRKLASNKKSIWEAIQYMHLYFNQNIDAKKTAAAFQFSVSQLNHELYQVTGKSFTENLHEIRIRNACAMMAFPELSITYIHQYVGYTSSATFYRVFKKMKGTTPDAYRSNNQNTFFSTSDKADTVWKIMMYISDHFKESITLEQVSQAIYLSPDTIKETIQNNLSLSFYELLHRIRMLYACSLLKATELEIAYIAAYVGYDSLRTFNRNFKEYMGVTPSQYRQERGSLSSFS